MTGVRRFSANVPVRTTSSGGHVILTESGVAVQGSGGAQQTAVT